MRFAPSRELLTPATATPALAGDPGCAQAFGRVDVLCFPIAAARLKDRALLLVSPGESFSANCLAAAVWDPL
jgi:hypothetical protein